jgi:phage portal protein BeeE
MRIPLLGRSESVRSEAWPELTFDEWTSWLSDYGTLNDGMINNLVTGIDSNWPGMVNGMFKSDGVVFACMERRRSVFSEARFQFRQGGKLFGTNELLPLEEPWTNATTGDLLSRALQDADIGGNAYFVRIGGQVRRLRPDFTRMVIASPDDNIWHPEAEVIGYIFETPTSKLIFAADEVAHFAPTPDPGHPFRGMSWLVPIIREVTADKAFTEFKIAYMRNGAAPSFKVTINETDATKWQALVDKFKLNHEGHGNRFKTLFVNSAMNAEVIGSNFDEIDFKKVQGAGETRIAAAAGVPAIVAGLSEGLESASYSNYGQARRAFGDETVRPLLRNVCGSFAKLVTVPAGAELWYDDSDIAFFREDSQDRATIQQAQATTITQLVNAGYTADSVVAAVMAGNFGLLVHTNLFSVQLQAAGTLMPNAGNSEQAAA